MPDPAEQIRPVTSGPLARASAAASRLCLWGAGAGLVALTAIILWQVFTRYVLNDSPAWSEQLALYVLVWTVLLGAAAGVREGFHIRITAVQNSLSPARRRMALIASNAVTALIGAVLAVEGARVVAALWGYAIPTLGLPRGSALLPLPVAGGLTVLFSVEHILAERRGLSVAPVWS